MNIEPDSKGELYQYFLTEAPELLQSLEETLLSLIEEKTVDKVHTLMRSAHTLKGSAASVEEETIKTIAHHLEDVFQALYAPELDIDPELGALLLDAYDCLRTPLSATLSDLTYDENAVLEQTAAIFAQLQTKLGDFFGREAPLPTSEELGFDVVGSIFSESITQDLEQLEAVIVSQDERQVEEVLRSQAEFFLELGISYNLPGLEEIAQTILAAIEQNQDRILEIAVAALDNFYQAREDILAGDRDRGGKVSAELQSWVQLNEVADEEQFFADSIDDDSELTIAFPAPIVADASSNIEPESEPTEIIAAEEDTEDELEVETVEAVKSVGSESEAIQVTAEHTVRSTSPLERILNSIAIVATPSSNEEKFQPPEVTTPPDSESQPSSLMPSIRVAIKQLDRLNHTVGELLIKENQQNLQHNRLQVLIKETLQQFRSCQQGLFQLSDWSDKQRRDRRRRQRKNSDRQGLTPGLLAGRRSLGKEAVAESDSATLDLRAESHLAHAPSALTPRQPTAISSPSRDISLVSTALKSQSATQTLFDSLELDAYSDLDIMVQTFTENMMQLGNKIEAIDRMLQQSYLDVGKRKQLLDRAQEDLFQARMVPLSTVLNRFPRHVQQMVATHKKPAQLKNIGSKVTIDKAIAEKLYEPLLHLIRNAYDHGLETPEVRQQHGKPEAGKITIHAYNQGNRTIIEIQDDGRGIDWERVLTKAMANELLRPNEVADISEAQLAEVLFKPGFSTASKVTDLSGRGVGLDVVKSQIEALDGTISVRSVRGRGTTFTLQLPLNLTTARLLLCQAKGITYALLSTEIERVLAPLPEQIQYRSSLAGEGMQSFWHWQQGEERELIPICPLENLISYEYPIVARSNSLLNAVAPQKSKKQRNSLLLVKTEGKKLCLQVEKILVEQELVIKSLSSLAIVPKYVQGYSVLGDGNLSLVINPIELVVRAYNTASLEVAEQPVFSQLSTQPLLTETAIMRPVPAKPTATEPAGGEMVSGSLTNNSLVLVVEDSIVQRQSLVMILENAGYQVLQAGNGKEAISQLNQYPEVRLVICDIEMPLMNGFEFLSYCQRDPQFSDIPVVMVTTRSGQKHRQLAVSLGAKSYLTKPASDRQLLTVIAELLAQSK